MNLTISAEEVFKIIKEKVTTGSSVINADDIEEIEFNYDHMADEVVGITVILKSNIY